MSRPSIEIIAAVARNRVIGRTGGLPWRLPDDLKFFKQTTMGHPVLMGRRTWEEVKKPLPGRRNIVVSNSIAELSGADVVRSLDDAIKLVSGTTDRAFIVGGAVLYQAALAIADVMLLTEIDADFEGDTLFPEFDKSRWKLVSEVPHPKDQKHEVSFRFCRYERVSPRA